MKKFVIRSVCLAVAALSGTAQANSNIAAYAPSASCFNACASAPIKKTRRIVRVEPVKVKKLTASAANHGKHLAKLNTGSQAYGKVLVPVNSTSRVKNVYRP